ncbi:MAG: hypothetical protein KAH95_00475 [Spirochaetales bacterium]|nr:hypothetical protein [Spirochaetales bacterium]
MTNHLYEFENLSTKLSFNNALGHFQTVSDVIGSIEDFDNVADTLNELLQEKIISQNQLIPSINAILFDKLEYQYNSYNMTNTISNFDVLVDEVKKWNGIDIVMIYYHPDLGPMLINPKNKNHFESIHTFKRNELITIYAGNFSPDNDKKIANIAISEIVKYLEGKKLKTSVELTKGKFKFGEKKVIKKKTVPVQKKSSKKTKVSTKSVKEEVVQEKVEQVISKPKRITPYYSVVVSNELFHNGNVEAWKKIIESYKAKYPGLEVYIYYDGERIHEIASLFKWGKVKHGSTILFAVAGDNIKDVAKLQRYLKQGASIMFESFLKFPVNKVLNLF